MHSPEKYCIFSNNTNIEKGADLLDSNSALQLVILILLLVLSGFFSSAETSLTTVSTIRLLSLAEQGNKRAQTVLKIRKDSGKC